MQYILLPLLLFAVHRTQAQCTGCTSTTSTNVAMTVNAGQVACLTFSGNYTANIVLNGGTLCISAATHITGGTITASAASTINNYGYITTAVTGLSAGYTLNNYKSFTGTISQNGGTVVNYSAATFSPTAVTFTSGTLTNNAGGTMTLPTGFSIGNGFTLTNNGTLSLPALTINAGGAMSLNTAQTISGSVTNGGTISISGNLTISGTYSDSAGATIRKTVSGCGIVSMTTNSGGNGTFDGNGYNLILTTGPANAASLINGATATPAVQPASLATSLSGQAISGSFTAPSQYIPGYIVLRSIGISAPTNNPVNYTSYSIGSVIGSCTVVAIISSSAAGTKNFTDNIPAASCNKNAYYRIFAYTGSGTCVTYNLTSPLTGSQAIPVATATITPAGPTTFCLGSSLALTASTGTYAWSTGDTATSITVSATGTYRVTVTNSSACTATASVATTVRVPVVNQGCNSPVCTGSQIKLTTASTGTSPLSYSWSGPNAYAANISNPTISSANIPHAGTYTVTVTDGGGCTATATVSLSINQNCLDSTTVGANGGNSSDAPCTQILRFDHYSDAVASSSYGQNTTWVLKNGNILSMNIKRTAGAYTPVTAPTWSGAAFGQSGYTGLSGKTVLYALTAGYSRVVFSNIYLKDSFGNQITNFTLIGIDGESTDNAERDTIISDGTSWFDYDTITPPSIGSVPSETGIGTSMLVWKGTGPVNARSRLVSTNNPNYITFSSVGGGQQGFAMGISNPVEAPAAVAICSNTAFNATPNNLPSNTTYTWDTPTITPPGSISGASAQLTGAVSVGQTLTNTTNAVAKAVYYVIPSNNCSGLGYLVTVTVYPVPAATVTPAGTQCAGNPLTGTASPQTPAVLSYRWSGPNAFSTSSSSSPSFTINPTAIANSGTYTVSMTDQYGCTGSSAGPITIVQCMNVAGTIFDDANGNGILDGSDAAGSLGQTLYSILSDSSGRVTSVGTIAANGSFSVNNVLPNTRGYTLAVAGTNPPLSSIAAGYAWPATWKGTLAQYGTNNAEGTGVYPSSSERVPVWATAGDISGVMIGYNRLPTAVSRSYVIARPHRNTALSLSSTGGMGALSGTDPEDGAFGTGNTFTISGVAGMNGNSLYYDANGDGSLQPAELIAPPATISSYIPDRLYMKFAGSGSTQASFTYGAVDASGNTNAMPATYTVGWSGTALPVTLLSFDAMAMGTYVRLRWATAAEINSDRFDVERSADGLQWSVVGSADGAGNSNETLNYSMRDLSPPAGKSYYRLREVDMDGGSAYSDIAGVTIGDGSAVMLTVHPNPSAQNSKVLIRLNDPMASIVRVTISNTLGEEIYNASPAPAASYAVSTRGMPAGSYLVKVTTMDQTVLVSRMMVE